MTHEEIKELLKNSDLKELVGTNISFIKANFNKLPKITFFEYDERNTFHCDDQVDETTNFYQFDIWTSGSFVEIKNVLERVLKENGFYRISVSPDMYEEDTKIYHKAVRYALVTTREGA